MLVATDGQTNDAAALAAVLSTFPSYIIPFSVGIGNANPTELLQIARNVAKNVMTLQTFDAFAANIGTLLERMCRETTPTTTSPSALAGCSHLNATHVTPKEIRYVSIDVAPVLQSIRVIASSGNVRVYVTTSYKNPGPSIYDILVSSEDNQPVYFDPSSGKIPQTKYERNVLLAARAMHPLSATTAQQTTRLYLAIVGGNETAEVVTVLLCTLKCTNNGNCSGRASVVAEDATGACTCTCRGQWTGPHCDFCPPSYSGENDCASCGLRYDGSYPDCYLQCNNTANCSGHAALVAGNSHTGCNCTCRNAWTGAACEKCPRTFNSTNDCASCAAGFMGYPHCRTMTTSATRSLRVSTTTSGSATQSRSRTYSPTRTALAFTLRFFVVFT